MSGVSLQSLPIQVWEKKEVIGINSCWLLYFHMKSSVFRIRAVLCFSGQHAVFGGWTDDHRRLLQHRERRMETNISNEGEEDGVWSCGYKWLYLCNRGLLILKRDLSAEHWEIRPSAGLLGDCGDSAQPGQITWMYLCFQHLVSNLYHKCCHFVPKRINWWTLFRQSMQNVRIAKRCQGNPLFFTG